jgi:hypothetical protein
MPWITTLAEYLLHSVKVSLPLDELRASAGDIVGGDYDKLRVDGAAALDKLLDIPTMPILGDLPEHAQEALAVELSDGLVSLVTGHPLDVVKAATAGNVAKVVVDSQKDAAAVLGASWFYRATHPAMVKAARGFGA